MADSLALKTNSFGALMPHLGRTWAALAPQVGRSCLKLGIRKICVYCTYSGCNPQVLPWIFDTYKYLIFPTVGGTRSLPCFANLFCVASVPQLRRRWGAPGPHLRRTWSTLRGFKAFGTLACRDVFSETILTAWYAFPLRKAAPTKSAARWLRALTVWARPLKLVRPQVMRLLRVRPPPENH